ncbi:MAG: hypothetical protein ACI85F_000487 [Bacteroidia bacterium]|jgi:hypothetical protein
MIKIIPAYVVLVALSVTGLFGQDFNRPIPNGFPKYEFRQFLQPTSETNYLTTPLYPSSVSTIRHISMMDENGYLKWYAGDGMEIFTNFEFHPGHDLFSYCALNDFTTYIWKFYVMDQAFNIIDSIVPVGEPVLDSHEFRILENGNYLIVGVTHTEENLSGYTFDGVPGGNPSVVKSFVIQEFENGNLVFDWKSIDHIHPEEFIDSYSFWFSDFDYAHGNAVEEDVDGNFLVSFRHLDAIYKIDRNTGEVIWILGGKSNQFDFVNDDGFSGQHDVRLLDNGNITLYDNGNSRPPPRFSRAVEFEMNYTDMTATRVWQYSDLHNSYSNGRGSVREGPDGERIIGFGTSTPPTASFVHLNAIGQTVSEMHLQDTVVSYRATRHSFSLDIDRPIITCFQDEFELTLSAPDGHDTYSWNTGDTTQTISVSDTGAYQVWASTGGIGMIGSAPFFLSDLSDPCGLETGLDPTINQAQQFIKAGNGNGVFEILLDGEMSVYNSVGQAIIQKSVAKSSVINISNQPKGVYVLVFESEDEGRAVKRVVKF